MKLPTANGGVSSGIAPSCPAIASGEGGSQPAFALKSFGAVYLAIHPCGKPQGILAKANKRVKYDWLIYRSQFCSDH